MPNRFQLKRTTTTGLLPNVSNSSNTSYIAAGELAINLTDRKLLSSNGSATFEIGANLTNLAVSGNVSATYYIGDGSYLTGLYGVVGQYLFANTVSDVSPYYQAQFVGNYTAGTTAENTVSVNNSPTLLGAFLTNVGFPNQTYIPIGIVNFSFETQKGSGASTYRTYAEIYKRTSGGTETLLLTSDVSSTSALNTLIQQSVLATNSTQITLGITDRILIKIYAQIISGADANITLRWDDATASGFNLPSPPASITQFVPYLNATANVNLGSYSIIAATAALGNTTITGFANVTSTLAAGNTSITGFINVSSTANVGGATTLRGTATVNGALTVANTAALGNTTITGFINVSSAANLNSLTVQNAVITANLEVTDTATINTNSIVVGNTTVNSTYGTSEIKVANSSGSVTITAAQVSVGANVYANTTAVDVGNTIITTTNLTLGGQVTANGGTGTAGQVLTSAGASANAYWAAFNTGPAFGAYANNTLQTITSGSQQKVLFQVEEFDTNNCYASSRFTPTVAGYYQLNSSVRIDGSTSTGEIMIVIWKNGAEHKRGTNQQGTQVANDFWEMSVSSIVYANGSTDFFEIYVQQTSGSNRSVTAVNSPAITWFNGAFVRPA